MIVTKVNNSTLKVRQSQLYPHHKAPNIQESQHGTNILEWIIAELSKMKLSNTFLSQLNGRSTNDLFKTRYQMLYSPGSNPFKTMPADPGHLAIFLDLFYILFKLRMQFRLVCFSLQNTIFLWDYMCPKSWIVHDDIENWNLYDFLPPPPPPPAKVSEFWKILKLLWFGSKARYQNSM